MGKKKRNWSQRTSDPAELSLQSLKKQKTLDSPLAQILARPSAQNSAPDNPLANENQKLDTALPLDTPKKKKKKKKKKKTGGSEQEPEISNLTEPTKKKKNRSSKNQTTRDFFKEKLKGIFYFKGKALDELLEKLSSAIEAMRHPKGKVLDNIWMKQRFSVGINDVTRTLERMPAALEKPVESYMGEPFSTCEGRDYEENGTNDRYVGIETKTHGQNTHLQAVLTSIDCHPRLIVSHLPGLASIRGVPLFCIEDHGTGSKRLGQLLKLETAIAIGIKAGEYTINSVIQDAINDQLMRLSTEMSVEPHEEMISEDE